MPGKQIQEQGDTIDILKKFGEAIAEAVSEISVRGKTSAVRIPERAELELLEHYRELAVMLPLQLIEGTTADAQVQEQQRIALVTQLREMLEEPPGLVFHLGTIERPNDLGTYNTIGANVGARDGTWMYVGLAFNSVGGTVRAVISKGAERSSALQLHPLYQTSEQFITGHIRHEDIADVTLEHVMAIQNIS
jgi:hypothetical protein